MTEEWAGVFTQRDIDSLSPSIRERLVWLCPGEQVPGARRGLWKIDHAMEEDGSLHLRFAVPSCGLIVEEMQDGGEWKQIARYVERNGELIEENDDG